MFIVDLTYIQPLDLVEKHLEAHVAFLKKHYSSGNFICSGRKQPRTGGIILCRAQSREEVDTLIQEDPFWKNRVADYRITEFLPTMHADGFEKFV